jgi:hypothetical protein
LTQSDSSISSIIRQIQQHKSARARSHNREHILHLHIFTDVDRAAGVTTAGISKGEPTARDIASGSDRSGIGDGYLTTRDYITREVITSSVATSTLGRTICCCRLGPSLCRASVIV